MVSRSSHEAVVAFGGAAVWLGGYAWIRSALGSTDPLYGAVLLAWMVAAVLVPVLWVTVRKRRAG